MTQIQASVNVEDKVDGRIEQKIKAIGVASVTTANQLNALKNAVSSLSSRNINGFSNAVASLGRTNFNGLASQMRQLSQVSSQLNGSFSQTALQATKLQIAQTKLQQEQTKASILTVRLQREQQALSNAQNQGAISANNLANAQARANTAQIRSQIASTQAITATIRLQREQARLEQQLQRNSQASHQANIGLRQLVGTMFALSSAGATIVGVAQLGDQYQSMINKLTLVTNTAEQARNRLASLTDVAKSSYSDLQSTTQLYTRLDMALKQTGGSASEAMQVTKTLSKTVALAGLTTAESSSALLQISQAFNKGKLDGDEFRTVMETMPPLADALSRKLGVTRGELLKLAPQGKITGEILKQAVLDMAETVDQKFANLVPTIAMQLQNLQTEAQTYFGAMFKDTGLAETFGNAIKYIANNLELATKVALAFGLAIGASFAIKGISSLIVTVQNVAKAYATATTAVNAFTLATRATPIGWLIAGISALALGLDTLFNSSVGKSLFPTYDQDKAKVEDYISRLKDINTQMGLMSYTQLTQENALLNQAMEKNKSTISDTEKKLADLNVQINKQQKEYDEATATLERFKSKQFTEKDYAIMASGVELNELALRKQADAQKQLIDLQAEQANVTRDLDKANESNVELMKSVLYNMEKQIEQIDNAKKAIDGKKQSDIDANEELKAQQKIVEDSKSKYEKLTQSVANLRNQLRLLVGLSANLSPAINETAQKTVDKVAEETKTRIQKETEWLNAYAKASADEQKRMEIRKQLSKDLSNERFTKADGNLTDEGQKLLDERVNAQKAVEARRKADAEAERNARKQAKDAQREVKNRENERQKAIEKQEQYVGKLDNELALLKEGYQNYSKYNSLYALRLELQQKGINLTDQEMTAIKGKIDAVEREKELAKEINTFEENSLQRQREIARLKLDALSKSNLGEPDRRIANDKILGDMGATATIGQGITSITEQYRIHYETIDQMRISDQEKEMAKNALQRKMNSDLFDQYVNNMKNMGSMWEVVGNTITSFEQGATTAITNVLMGTSSISDAMRSLANTILNEVVNSIVKMGVRWAIEQATMLAIGTTNQQTATAQAVASGAAITSAMTPAATATAIATQGASVGAGMTALMGAFMAIPALIALAGKRKNGGAVNAGSLYQVGEGNAPEIYQSRSGRQYMIAGDNGRVFSNKDVTGGSGGGTTIIQNITYQGSGDEVQDKRTMQNLSKSLRATILDVIRSESRIGGELARG